MDAPPLEIGADHPTVADALPDEALTVIGGPGTVAGVTAFEATEAAP
jgi:hypothetical protein